MTVSLRSWSRDVRRSSHVPLFNVYICSSMANSRVVVTNHCALNLTQLYYGFLSCLLSQAQVFKAAVTESHPGSQTFWKHLIVAPQRRLPLTAYPHLHLSLWISLGTCILHSHIRPRSSQYYFKLFPISSHAKKHQQRLTQFNQPQTS
jgi:hypothetical protein